MTNRSVTVTLGLKAREYVTGAGQAAEATKRLTGSMREFQGELGKAARSGHLEKVADAATHLGLVGVGAFAAVTAAAAQFDKQMSSVRAATHANTRDMGLLRQAALQAGKDTAFSATQAAQGIEELSKAGVSTSAILGGGLKGALSLAAAGQLEVGEAAETAASAMTQFKLGGEQVSHIADLLAAGAGKAQGSVQDLGMALNQSGLVAAQMGLSVEDTTGALAAFASAGLIGSDAGTSFKTMLLALAKPSKEATETMEKLGVTAYDASGQFVGVTNLAGQLQDRLGTLTQEQRNSALSTIFGTDAIRAASVLYSQGAQGIQGWIDKTNDAGFAAETARLKTDNLIGDLERLKGSLETMAIESGGGANAGLRVLTKSADALVEQFAGLPTAVGGTITVLAGLGGAALLAFAGWAKMRKATTEALDELAKTGPVGARAAEGLEKTRKAAFKAAAGFVAAEAAAAGLNAIGDKSANVDRLTDSLTNLANTGNSTGELNDVFGKNFDNLDRITGVAQAADSGMGKFFNDVAGGIPVVGSLSKALGNLGLREMFGTDLESAPQQLEALDQAFVNTIETTNDAGKANALWQQAVLQSGRDATVLAEMLPNTYKALGELNTQAERSDPALGGAAAASNRVARAVGAVGDSAEDAQKKIKELTDALQAQSDPVFALLKAQRDFREAQDAAAEAVAKHGRNSKEAKVATEELAQAAVDVGVKALQLGTTFDGKLTPALRATLVAAGLTAPQIATVEQRFQAAKKAGDKFAGKYAAEVSVTGDKPALGRLQKLYTMQNALKQGISFNDPRLSTNKADFLKYDRGGWTGPGGKYQPAGIVHADEFVVRKESRQKIEQSHPGMLDHLNRTGHLPGYAAGGAVWPFPVNASMTRIPSKSEVSAKVTPSFGAWPSSPMPGPDSGVWHAIVALARASGISNSPGSNYRAGSTTPSGRPDWHSMGRAVDFMGYNQDPLASFFAAKRPLELIHRSNHRDYAYSRGVNMGSFDAATMEAHRNHVHVAMRNGGVIDEHIIGVGRSGRTYEFGEAGREFVVPGYAAGGRVAGYAGGGFVNVEPADAPSTRATRLDSAGAYLRARDAVDSLTASLKENGRSFAAATVKGRDNRRAVYDVIQAAQDAAKTKYDETGSVRAANAAYDAHIVRLRRTLAQQKINAATIRTLLATAARPSYDVTTRAPTNSLANIAFAKSAITAAGGIEDLRDKLSLNRASVSLATPEGRENLSAILDFLGQASSAAQDRFTQTRNAGTATGLYNTYLAQLRAALKANGYSTATINSLLSAYGRITLTPNARGGAYMAATGLASLDRAQVYPTGRTMYGFAEPGTGGEMFLPMHGDRQRGRDLLQIGAGWYGGRFVTGGSGGGQVTNHYETNLNVTPLTAHLSMTELEGLVRQVDAKNRVGRRN